MLKDARIIAAGNYLREVGFQGNCNFAVVGSYETTFFEQQACHLGLKSKKADSTPNRKALVNLINVKDEAKAKPYLYWLLNESPFSHCYYSKDVDVVLKELYVVHRVDVPANLLAGSCITLRHLHENPAIIPNWLALTERGVDKNLAFILAHIGMSSDSSFNSAQTTEGHTCLCVSAMGKDSAYNFVNGKALHKRSGYNYDVDYNGVSKAWGETVAESVSIRRMLTDHFKEFSLKVESTYVNNNPFVKYNHYRGGSNFSRLPLEEAYDWMAQWAKEFMEGKVDVPVVDEKVEVVVPWG